MTAAIEADSLSGPAPHVVHFSDASTGPVESRVWSFGDATATTDAADPIHSFLEAGTYEVQLDVTGPSNTSTATVTVTVEPTPPAPPPDSGHGEHLSKCTLSHRLADDPLRFPGLEGASPSIDFFGNAAADAYATPEILTDSAATTCEPDEDRSAYWTPTLLVDGEPAPVNEAQMFYTVDNNVSTAVRGFPVGLAMLAGDPDRSGPDDGPSYFKWSCRGDPTSSTDDLVVCPDGHELELLIRFPDCWNGTDLDAADHRSHVAYSAAGECPDTHPVPVPRLEYKIEYDTTGSDDTTLSTGPGYTAFAGVISAWEPGALEDITQDCLAQLVKCEPGA